MNIAVTQSNYTSQTVNATVTTCCSICSLQLVYTKCSDWAPPPELSAMCTYTACTYTASYVGILHMFSWWSRIDKTAPVGLNLSIFKKCEHYCLYTPVNAWKLSVIALMVSSVLYRRRRGASARSHVPPSHQQHGQQASGGGARGRGFTSTTSWRCSTGALHSPGGWGWRFFRKAPHWTDMSSFIWRVVLVFLIVVLVFMCVPVFAGGGSHQYDALRWPHSV